MRLTKEEIIRTYRKRRLELGRAPTSKEFFKILPRGACEEVFPKNTYSEIQSAVGDEPRGFGQRARSEDEFCEIYGKAIKEDIGHVPTAAEWRSKKIKPTVSGYQKRLKVRWSQMPRVFINWAIDKPEWEETVDVCESHCKQKTPYRTEGRALTTNRGYVYLLKANGKGQYKIGRTGSPSGRASQLSQLDAYDRRYEHVFETSDPIAFENYWKEYRFKDKRISKEIFRLTQDDVRTFKDFYAREARR